MAVADTSRVLPHAKPIIDTDDSDASVLATRAQTPLTIVHAFEPGEYGGLERVVEGLAVVQRRAGHRVHVICIRRDHADDPLADRLRQSDVRVEHIIVGPRAYFAERAAVRRVLERLAPHIVHTHGFRPDVLLAGVARRLGLTTVTTAHGRTGGSMKITLYERLQDRAFSRFDAVAVVSRPLLDDLIRRGIDPSRLHLVPNGWMGGVVPALDREAARMALGVASDEMNIGWAGRVSAEKGPDVLVDAMALLRGENIAASVLGDGTLLDAMRERARLAQARMRWHGAVPNAARFFPGFDAFVLSSRTEGTPIALLEAMAAETPIIATAVGGVPGVVGDDEALLIPSENPQALADAIREVRDAPERARTRATRARQRLERDFSIATWLRRYADVYDRARCGRPSTELSPRRRRMRESHN
jgi:glycosyltransferase involved in cell wall biosynthesis